MDSDLVVAAAKTQHVVVVVQEGNYNALYLFGSRFRTSR